MQRSSRILLLAGLLAVYGMTLPRTLAAKAAAAESEPEFGEDSEQDPRHPLTPELVQQYYPVTERELNCPVAEFRELAEKVAAGTTDLRILRAYFRMYPRLFPFDYVPAADARPRALAAKAALEARAASQKTVPPTVGEWYPMGPRNIPGRTTALALHPTEPNTVYAGGADGGVWKTTDLGATWTPLTDFQPTLAMGALAIDPIDPRIVYAGTGEANYSGDAYGGVGVLKTTTAGAAWSIVSNPSPYFHDLAIDPRDRTKLWAATTSGLFRSTDSAASWTPAGGGLPAQDATSFLISLKPTSPRVMLAGIGGGAAANRGLWRSTNDGVTWTQVTTIPTSNGRVSMSQSAGDPNRIYLALATAGGGSVRGLFRSDDEGASWSEPAACGGCSSGSDPCCFCSGQCWYDMAIAADAVNPDLVYTGGQAIYRSTDGGVSWTHASSGIHVDQHVLVSPAANVLWAANDGGLYQTTDAGANWTDVGRKMQTAQYYHITTDPTDDSFCIGGTQDNGTHRFTGSADWDFIRGGDGAYTAISPLDPKTYFASYQNLYFARSRSRGAGFQETPLLCDSCSCAGNPINQCGGGACPSCAGCPAESVACDPRGFIAAYGLDRSDPRTVFACTQRLWRSSDEGDTFVDLSASVTLTAGIVSAVDNCRDVPASIWVGTSDGKVWNTQDGGTNWRDRSAGLPGRYVTSIGPHPTLPLTAYVSVGGTGLAGHIWRTGDGGVTWTNATAATSGFPDISVNHVLLVDDRPTTLIAATDLGIYRTDDSGTSWTVYGSNLPNVAVDWLAYSPATNTLRAGTHGRGAWQLGPPNSCIFNPEFAGLNSPAVIPDGAGGCAAELTWDAATSTCATAPGIRYNVYRTTDPLALPTAPPLVAGLAATSYRDASVVPGTVYYYTVRAEDSQTTFGGPANGGRESRNDVTVRFVQGDALALGSLADDGGDTRAWLQSRYWSVSDLDNTTAGGRFSYQSVARGDGGYGPNRCEALATPDMVIGLGATLRYNASYNIEYQWDGVVVEISTDGGSVWTDLPPSGGYPSDLRLTGTPPINGCGLSGTRAAFNGPPANLAPSGFAPYTSSLAAYVGQTARIRWLFTTDPAAEYEGFLLDDVNISNVSSPALPASGNVLMGVRTLSSAPKFTWADVATITHYRVYHATAKDLAGRALVGEVSSGTVGVTDPTPRPTGVHFYRLHTVVDCVREEP